MILQFHLVLLVLLAALIHAFWNAVVKSAGDRVLTMTLIHFTGAMIGGVAIFFVGLPDPAVWPYLLISVVVHNFYYLFLLLSYRVGDLSEVYPIARGSSPLLVVALAMVLAGEVPTAGAMAGIALVSVGIVSLTFAKGRISRAGMKPIGLALITGTLIASYTVIDGLGIRSGASPWPYIAWLNFLEGVPITLWALSRRTPDIKPFLVSSWKPGVLGGSLALLAYAAALYALNEGAMAHVSALRETSVLFATLIGALVLKEGFGWRRIVCALLITAGIFILQVFG
ncbi:MAG: EamA family transporter [Rhodospirillales bacterium]|nr:EamA family transporter [Rhodospirillales bacterium]